MKLLGMQTIFNVMSREFCNKIIYIIINIIRRVYEVNVIEIKIKIKKYGTQ